MVLPAPAASQVSQTSQATEIRGHVRNISEVGACIATNTALEDGRPVSVDVRYGRSFLFGARAQVVWRSPSLGTNEAFDRFHGIVFTDLSTFSRKIIRRVCGVVDDSTKSIPNAPAGSSSDGVCADLDAEFFFPGPAPNQPSSPANEAFDMLSDPALEMLLLDGLEPSNEGEMSSADHSARGLSFDILRDVTLEALLLEESREGKQTSVTLAPLEPRPWHHDKSIFPSGQSSIEHRQDPDFNQCPIDSAGAAELSGFLGYFNSADVLQMLEAAQATGIVYLDGEDAGELHLQGGRICGLFSKGVLTEETAFRLILSRRGRFHFVPTVVRSNLRKCFTTTQLLLEAEHRRDRN